MLDEMHLYPAFRIQRSSPIETSLSFSCKRSPGHLIGLLPACPSHAVSGERWETPRAVNIDNVAARVAVRGYLCHAVLAVGRFSIPYPWHLHVSLDRSRSMNAALVLRSSESAVPDRHQESVS